MIRKNTLRQFVAVFILTVLTISTATAQEPDTYIEELRGVWITNVDSDVLSSKQKIADAMDFLAERGFNVVFR